MNELALVARSGSDSHSVSFVADSGATYVFSVESVSAGGDLFGLNVELEALPANDAFANRFVLTGSSVGFDGTNTFATSEAVEPNHAGQSAGRSLWWSWTAPSSGTVTLSVNPRNFSPILALYTGNTLAALTPIANAVGSSLLFDAIAGSVYNIALDALDNGGEASLSLAYDPPPSNNQFENRTAVTGWKWAYTGTLAGADKQSAEPDHASRPGRSSLWWTWTAPDSGTARISVSGHAFSSIIAVYTGTSFQDLHPVAGSVAATLDFAVVREVTYQIALDCDNGVPGPFTLAVSLITPPSNDNFANAGSVTEMPAVLSGDTRNATTEAGEFLPPSAAGKTIWWSWTASHYGTLSMTITGGPLNANPLISVYTGSALTNLTMVASNSYQTIRPPHGGHDEGLGLASLPPVPPSRFEWRVRNTLALETTPGTTYEISADGLTGNAGPIVLACSFTQHPPPVNDQFQNRVLIQGLAVSLAASNSFGSRELGEPNQAGDAGGASVWWTWTAPASALVRVTANAGFTTLIGAYTGDVLSNLVEVGSGRNQVEWYATQGAQYQIAIDGLGGTNGSFDFSLKTYFPPPNDSFLDAVPVQGEQFAITGHNVGASLESGEPNHGGDQTGDSVWWTWTAPFAGRATLTLAANFPARIAVYVGDALDNLRTVAIAQSNLYFTADAGTKFYIAVAGEKGANGDFGLSLILGRAPSNDKFAFRTRLAVQYPVASGSTINASREPGEALIPGSISGSSVWYEWTAPSSGTVTLGLADGSRGLPFAVFAGSTLTHLVRIAQAPDSNAYYRTRFYALAGTSYQIAFSDDAGAEGEFAFVLQPPPPAPTLGAAASFQTGGAFHLRIVGANAQSFVIEVSTNLVDWASLSIDTIFGSSSDFVDVDAPIFPHRFYRVRSLDAYFSPSGLRVDPSGMRSDGFLLRVTGPSAQPYLLQASTNLHTWVELSRGVIVGDSLNFTDAQAQQFPHRFYRAISLP